jgi:hypothetical protein
MCAHALSLSHPGIRCRCLAAYGDAVSAVKWYLLFPPCLITDELQKCFITDYSSCITYILLSYAGQVGLVGNIMMIWHNL